VRQALVRQALVRQALVRQALVQQALVQQALVQQALERPWAPQQPQAVSRAPGERAELEAWAQAQQQ